MRCRWAVVLEARRCVLLLHTTFLKRRCDAHARAAVLGSVAERTGFKDVKSMEVLVADVMDHKSLEAMCRRSRIVVNCVGPVRSAQGRKERIGTDMNTVSFLWGKRCQSMREQRYTLLGHQWRAAGAKTTTTLPLLSVSSIVLPMSSTFMSRNPIATLL